MVGVEVRVLGGVLDLDIHQKALTDIEGGVKNYLKETRNRGIQQAEEAKAAREARASGK